jgi:hypothetical protein
MTPFYTVDGRPVLKGDDLRQYMKVWFECVRDRWVEIHDGSDESGFCASKHGRETEIAASICGGG